VGHIIAPLLSLIPARAHHFLRTIIRVAPARFVSRLARHRAVQEWIIRRAHPVVHKTAQSGKFIRVRRVCGEIGAFEGISGEIVQLLRWADATVILGGERLPGKTREDVRWHVDEGRFDETVHVRGVRRADAAHRVVAVVPRHFREDVIVRAIWLAAQEREEGAAVQSGGDRQTGRIEKRR